MGDSIFHFLETDVLITAKWVNISLFPEQDALANAVRDSIYQVLEISVSNHAGSKKCTLKVAKNVQVLADRAFSNHHQGRFA